MRIVADCGCIIDDYGKSTTGAFSYVITACNAHHLRQGFAIPWSAFLRDRRLDEAERRVGPRHSGETEGGDD
jgi:hypothetical protein